MVKIKRVYEEEDPTDGYRVLVDRLWPRGVKKNKLKYDEWSKVIAPSPEIRIKFGHKPENWKTFSQDYKKELKSKEAQEKILELAKKSKKQTITLLYAAKDETYNHARILKSVIEKKTK